MLLTGFDLGTFFDNLFTMGKKWGGSFAMFFGVIMLLSAIITIGKGFMSHWKGQTNWLMAIGCLLVGGFLIASGTNMTGIINFSSVGQETLEQLATPGGGTP